MEIFLQKYYLVSSALNSKDWFILIVAVCVLVHALLNTVFILVLNPKFDPKFKPNFMKYIEPTLWLSPFANMNRANHYALCVAWPSYFANLPNAEGYDFRSRVNGFVYLLCIVYTVGLVCGMAALILSLFYFLAFKILSKGPAPTSLCLAITQYCEMMFSSFPRRPLEFIVLSTPVFGLANYLLRFPLKRRLLPKLDPDLKAPVSDATRRGFLRLVPTNGYRAAQYGLFAGAPRLFAGQFKGYDFKSKLTRGDLAWCRLAAGCGIYARCLILPAFGYLAIRLWVWGR